MNRRDDMRRLLDLGVDGIFLSTRPWTDDHVSLFEIVRMGEPADP